RRDGREADVLPGGAEGGMRQGRRQRRRGAEQAAAGAQVPAALEADERAGDAVLGQVRRLGGPAGDGGAEQGGGGGDDLPLLFVGQAGRGGGELSGVGQFLGAHRRN